MKWTRLFRGVASRFTAIVAIGLLSLTLVVADAFLSFLNLFKTLSIIAFRFLQLLVK